MDNKLKCPICKNVLSIICLKILMDDNSKIYRCLKCNKTFSNIQEQNDKIEIIYKYNNLYQI